MARSAMRLPRYSIGDIMIWAYSPTNQTGRTVKRMLDMTVGSMLGVIILIGSAGAIIGKLISKLFKLGRRLEIVELECSVNKKGFMAMCHCMIALMDNACTGNSIDRVRSARDELQAYLIENNGGPS